MQDRTSELSALIGRAKHLMGVIDRGRGGSIAGSESGTTRLIQKHGGYSPMAGSAVPDLSPRRPGGSLRTVNENRVRLSSEDSCVATVGWIMGRSAAFPFDSMCWLHSCFGLLQDTGGKLLDDRTNQAKGSLAAAYAALNRNYEEQSKGEFTHTLTDVVNTFADNSSATGSEIQKLVPALESSSSTDSDQMDPGGNGLGKFLNTEDLEKLNMIAAAQKVAAYHVQQSHLLTVVRFLRW